MTPFLYHAPIIHPPFLQQPVAWLSSSLQAAPNIAFKAGDELSADSALESAHTGKAMLWQGDFQNAKHLLDAMRRRLQKNKTPPKAEGKEYFHKVRIYQISQARVLSRLLIPITIKDNAYTIELRRAPDISSALAHVFDTPSNWLKMQSSTLQKNPILLISLRDLLGIIGAYEWYKKGVSLPFLPIPIHVWHGVFSPIRSEYLSLVEAAPLPPQAKTVLDIGTGSGVLAAHILHRGIKHAHISDIQPRALACAQENLERLGFTGRYTVHSEAGVPSTLKNIDLIICNPPWIPTKPSSPLEQAMYDPDHQFLRTVLKEAKHLLSSTGECWVILSNIAEHLGLRDPSSLLAWFAENGWELIGQTRTPPKHRKAYDTSDWLYAARSQEQTSLWRLKALF